MRVDSHDRLLSTSTLESSRSATVIGQSPVAQLAERSAVNRRVEGSSPSGGAWVPAGNGLGLFRVPKRARQHRISRRAGFVVGNHDGGATPELSVVRAGRQIAGTAGSSPAGGRNNLCTGYLRLLSGGPGYRLAVGRRFVMSITRPSISPVPVHAGPSVMTPLVARFVGQLLQKERERGK